MIPLRINLYASLQKLEDESKFGPEETFLNFTRAATTPKYLQKVG